MWLNPLMARRGGVELAAARAATSVRARIGDDVRHLCHDAGLTQSALARAAGVPQPFISRLLDGTAKPSVETYAKLATALGADLSLRLYPNTGPSIIDRHQARILEALLATLHPRWKPFPEVAVRTPARGWIDVGLHDRRDSIFVATEIESSLRRLEQQLRWALEKAESLPSWEGWSRLPDAAPAISRLLIVRWTRTSRQVAREFARQMRAAYPADSEDVLDALRGDAEWPGAGILWARLEGNAQLVPG